MIEIRNTRFLCNSCESDKDVMAISIGLEGSTQTSSFRLCPACREQLMELLNR